MDPKIESEIDKFIKYIRRMNSITDDNQLEMLLTIMYNKNQETYTGVGVDLAGHVKWIREMSRYSDDKLRLIMREQCKWDLTLQNIFEDSSKRRALKEVSDAAKDYKSNPRSFARKVDSDFRR